MTCFWAYYAKFEDCGPAGWTPTGAEKRPGAGQPGARCASNMSDRLPIIIRVIGIGGGLFGGGITGGLIFIFTVMLTGKNLGLNSVWPGVEIGATAGGLIGLIFPKVGIKLADIFRNFTP